MPTLTTNRNRTPRILMFAGVSLSLLLAGCTSNGDPEAPAPSSTEEAPAETSGETEPAEAAPLEIPDCETLNPFLYEQSVAFQNENPTAAGPSEADLEWFNEFTGDAAQTAMDAAEQVQGCQYPVHIEMSAFEWVAEISTEDQAPFIEELRADDAITEESAGGALVFSLAVPDGVVQEEVSVTYVFAGNTWITVFDGIKDNEITDEAINDLLQPIKDANPDADFSPIAAPPAEGDGEQCADTSAVDALVEYGGQLEPFSTGGGSTHPWDLESEMTIAEAEETYDPCAALSSITVTIEGGTASSPSHIMLFNYGEYLGTATSDPKGFWPETVRVDDSTLEVTYKYPEAGDSNADPSGVAVSTFTWDEASQSVEHSGEFPPE